MLSIFWCCYSAAIQQLPLPQTSADVSLKEIPDTANLEKILQYQDKKFRPISFYGERGVRATQNTNRRPKDSPDSATGVPRTRRGPY